MKKYESLYLNIFSLGGGGGGLAGVRRGVKLFIYLNRRVFVMSPHN